MDSHQRRQIRRIEERIRKELGLEVATKEVPQPKVPAPQSQIKRVFDRPLAKTIAIVSFIASVVGLFVLRPHVSLEPDLLLNPGDPFSTQFSATNQNLVLDVTDVQPGCQTIYVVTSNHFGMAGLPSRPSPVIPRLRPQEKSTITCPPWVGGLGAGAGNVLVAYIEIDLSYKQVIGVRERFPFKGAVDSQHGVHWTHITPEQLENELSKR
jgi:hypothetical protein